MHALRQCSHRSKLLRFRAYKPKLKGDCPQFPCHGAGGRPHKTGDDSGLSTDGAEPEDTEEQDNQHGDDCDQRYTARARQQQAMGKRGLSPQNRRY